MLPVSVAALSKKRHQVSRCPLIAHIFITVLMFVLNFMRNAFCTTPESKLRLVAVKTVRPVNSQKVGQEAAIVLLSAVRILPAISVVIITVAIPIRVTRFATSTWTIHFPVTVVVTKSFAAHPDRMCQFHCIPFRPIRRARLCLRRRHSRTRHCSHHMDRPNRRLHHSRTRSRHHHMVRLCRHRHCSHTIWDSRTDHRPRRHHRSHIGIREDSLHRDNRHRRHHYISSSSSRLFRDNAWTPSRLCPLVP